MSDDRKLAKCPWFVVGCGYVGARLSVRLADAGATVTITRRKQEDADALASSIGRGVRGVAADLADLTSLDGLFDQGAIVVDSVPPADSTDNEKHLVQVLATANAKRLVYLSSTGVYPATPDGGWVDEDHETGPVGDRGRSRLAAETLVLDEASERGLEAVALRIVGIYGPGRGVAARMLAGTYRVIGAGDSVVCRIHVDDLVSAIIAAALAEPLARNIYNIADNEPTTSREHADGVAAMLGLEPPPSLPLEEASPAARAMLGANRRVSNARMVRELGVQLRYPSWREGQRQAIDEDASR